MWETVTLPLNPAERGDLVHHGHTLVHTLVHSLPTSNRPGGARDGAEAISSIHPSISLPTAKSLPLKWRSWRSRSLSAHEKLEEDASLRLSPETGSNEVDGSTTNMQEGKEGSLQSQPLLPLWAGRAVGLRCTARLSLRRHLHVNGRPKQAFLPFDFGTGNWRRVEKRKTISSSAPYF